MQVTYRGFVNTWDIDEMGHMNVQHYIDRFHQGFNFLCATTPGLAGLRLAEMTVAFVKEMRVANQMEVRTAIVAAEDGRATLHHHMVNLESGDTAASCIMEAEYEGAFDRGLVEASPFDAAIMPRPVPHFTPTNPASMAEADRLGMFDTSRQMVRPAECGPDGNLLPRFMMSRFSDGAAQMWRGIGILRDVNETGVGSAVVQMWLKFVNPAKAGTALVVRSGAWNMGTKSVSFATWLLDAATGDAIAEGGSIAVAFDTKARKAVSFTDDMRASAEAKLLGK